MQASLSIYKAAKVQYSKPPQASSSAVAHWEQVEAEAKAHIAALSHDKKLIFMRSIAHNFAYRG